MNLCSGTHIHHLYQAYKSLEDDFFSISANQTQELCIADMFFNWQNICANIYFFTFCFRVEDFLSWSQSEEKNNP